MSLPKLVTGWLSVALSAGALAAEPDPFLLLKNERLGGVSIEMPAAKLPEWPQCPVKTGTRQLWGTDGLYHQSWDYPRCGMRFDMISDQPDGPQRVFSVTVKAPSRWATRRGIRIGSSEQDARKAYAREFNAAESQPGKTLVFGSIYGGLILTLQRGRVSEMFLGAAAE